VADALRNGVYAEPALVPACTWLGKALPAQPVLTAKESRREIKLNWKEEPDGVRQWVVRKKNGRPLDHGDLPGAQTKEVIKSDGTDRAAGNHHGLSREPLRAIWASAAVFSSGHLEKDARRRPLFTCIFWAMIEALCPPKPKELLSELWTSILPGSIGT